ncbi:MAG TPA: 3-deoxy-D-manno-octulosonic acid transferase [Candidatus Brocadiia bacterium]|nr:3-deoxy-D-manno-octulosonic acid transferase [Candidatus Brocadiia bacterium]
MSLILDTAYLVGGGAMLPYAAVRAALSARWRAGIPERLGFAPRREGGAPCVVIHAASVGEAGIPKPLVALIRKEHPELEICFTTNTNTGMAGIRKQYDGLRAVYFPFDFSPCVGGFYRRIRPCLALMVELELWPNFLLAARDRGMPVAVVNGRMGAKSCRWIGRLARAAPAILDALAIVCARSEEDAERFVRAGVAPDRVVVTGNMKFDAVNPRQASDRVAALRRLFGLADDARTLVGGSTHPGEETALALAFAELTRRFPSARLVLAPRHVERASAAAAAVEAAGFKCLRKTALDAGSVSAAGAKDEVILVDTVGDLVNVYGLAEVVFVGGSLIPHGGQNMMEPAALGKPVVFGPHTFNFPFESEALIRSGGAFRVADASGLKDRLVGLFSDPASARSAGCLAAETIEKNKGAAERTYNKIKPFLFEGKRNTITFR